MCTVTYIPTKKNNFVLTSNRDEKVSRKPSHKPQIESLYNQYVMFPRDKSAGGTWIASSKNGRTVCLLNGAFTAHEVKESYRKSRGLVVLDSFSYNDIQKFFNSYPLIGIEPFTLIAIEQGDENQLYEFRWDGQTRFLETLDPSNAYIWSSVTLYAPQEIKQRQKWFADWYIDKDQVNTETILEFHQQKTDRFNNEGIFISRPNGKETVSITQVLSTTESVKMKHQNFTTGEIDNMILVKNNTQNVLA